MAPPKPTVHLCLLCGVKFTRKTSLKYHIKTLHARALLVHQCQQCGGIFQTLDALRRHRENHAPQHRFILRQHAFKGRCKLYRKYSTYINNRPIMTVEEMFQQVKEELPELLNHEIFIRHKIKVAIIVMMEMIKVSPEGNIEDTLNLPLRTPYRELYNNEDVNSFILYSKHICENRLNDFLNNGSGWQAREALYLDSELINCVSLDGSCHKLEILFPAQLRHQKEKIVLNGKEPNCFLKCIASHFTKSTNNKILNNFIRQNLKLEDIALPMAVKNIAKFEKLNSHLDFKVHVLYAEGLTVYPIRVSTSKSNNPIILILYSVMQKKSAQEQMECIHHYSLIKNINNFLRKYYNNEKRSRQQNHYCINCLNGLPTEAQLQSHQQICFKKEMQHVKVPVKGENIIEFINYNRKYPLHFVGFADFECILKSPIYACEQCKLKKGQKPLEMKCNHRTLTDSQQQPFMYNLIILDQHQNLRFHKTYIGLDCAENLLNTLLSIEEQLSMELLIHYDMNLTEEDFFTIKNTTQCHICEKEIEPGTITHRDHDHLSSAGTFLGLSHPSCNLNRRIQHKIPIYWHNFEYYDSHFIVKNLTTIKDKLKINKFNVIAANTERFKKMQINIFDMVDSFAMLPSSLESLVESLKTDTNCQFKILDQWPMWQERGLDKTVLKPYILRKGCYPYEYMTDISKLHNCKHIPKKKHFYSNLSNKGITKQEHEYAKFIFREFKCKNMECYSKLYCESDVYLLAEVLFTFRREIDKIFKLDICQYISLPQLSFDILLKKTQVKLELLTDLDQILMVESGMRGGISYCNTRYGKNTWYKQQQQQRKKKSNPGNRNNPAFKNNPAYKNDPGIKNDDDQKYYTDLRYIDANALYTWCQSQPLPLNNYHWLTTEEIKAIDWSRQSLNQNFGYILECTLHYPKKLHKSHNAYPLAPVHIEINYNDLSPFAKQCKKVLDDSETYKATKLSATFADRVDYVIHYMNLALYLQLGMKLVSIKRVLAFNQSAYLEPFMSYCTEERKQAKSEFRKNIFKLIANSCFGKFIENVRKYVDCRLVMCDKMFTTYVNKPLFKKFHILDENSAFFFFGKSQVTLNKCYPVGFSILELSKYHMFKTYYQTIRKVDPRCDLIMTDTDSFAIAFKVKANENIMDKLKPILDLSNYPTNDPRYDATNKGKLGYYKDEGCGKTLKVIFYLYFFYFY